MRAVETKPSLITGSWHSFRDPVLWQEDQTPLQSKERTCTLALLVCAHQLRKPSTLGSCHVKLEGCHLAALSETPSPCCNDAQVSTRTVTELSQHQSRDALAAQSCSRAACDPTTAGKGTAPARTTAMLKASSKLITYTKCSCWSPAREITLFLLLPRNATLPLALL